MNKVLVVAAISYSSTPSGLSCGWSCSRLHHCSKRLTQHTM